MLSTRKANISLLTCSPNFLHTALGKQQRNRCHKTASGQKQSSTQRMQNHKQSMEQPESSEVGDSQHSAAASGLGFQILSYTSAKLWMGLGFSQLCLCQSQELVAPHINLFMSLTPHKTPSCKKATAHLLKPRLLATENSCKVVV